MFTMHKKDAVYVANRIGSDLRFPTHLRLVRNFPATLKSLMFWKVYFYCLN